MRALSTALVLLALSTPFTAASGSFSLLMPYSAAPIATGCLDTPCTAVVPGREQVVGPFAGDHFADVTVSDVTGQPVGGVYRILSSSGTVLGQAGFCGHVSGLWFPQGVRLHVRVDTPGETQRCAGSPGGTVGTVHYWFNEA